MTELEISVAGGPGWRTLRYGAVHGLVGDDLPPAVAEELDALGSAESAPSLDDVVDALLAAGVRRAPDGVLAEDRRVVVRGGCVARLFAADGHEAAVVVHDRPGPWVEAEVEPAVTRVELLPTADAPSSQAAGAGLRLVPEWQPPSVLGEVAITRVDLPEASVAAPAAPTAPAEEDAPAQEDVRVEQDAPAAKEAITEAAAAATGAPVVEQAPEDTGVPDYDFLFGDTQAARSLPVEPAGEDPAAGPLTADEVDAAAGVTRGEDPGAATILPGDEPADEEPPAPSPPAQAPVAPDPAPADPPAQAPGSGTLISAVPWARGGAATSTPAAAAPPAVTPAPGPAAPPAPSSQPAPPPSSEPAAPRRPAAVAAESPAVSPPPAAATPPPPGTAPPPQVAEAPSTEELSDVTQGRDALIAQAASVDGPKVLAVICPAGHLSPPHRDSCRVCGRQVADQQAFEAARPALGVLRLESGDKVPLDRGVLLGRSPKAKADLEVARQPHVVKLPSPDNDLSRNHLEIVIDGWHVLARDLGSTNGTTVQLPGSAPTRLRPDEHLALEAGAVLVLADVVTVVYEVGP